MVRYTDANKSQQTFLNGRQANASSMGSASGFWMAFSATTRSGLSVKPAVSATDWMAHR